MVDREAVIPVPTTDLDERTVEGWVRESSEPDLRRVEALHLDDPAWPWMVVVSAMELVRSEPLEPEIRHALAMALLATPGVADVTSEDRKGLDRLRVARRARPGDRRGSHRGSVR